MNAYLNTLKNFSFAGRASRKEYWMFYLFFVIFYLLLLGVAAMVTSMFSNSTSETPPSSMMFLPYALVLIYVLGNFIQQLAVTVRRLHDTGRSGWWILIALIPIAGAIWFFILLVLDSDVGTNAYGENPHGNNTDKNGINTI